MEFPSPGPLVSASGAAPGGWNPRAVLDKLRLRRQEISLAAETVNKVVDHLLRGLKSCDSEFKDVGLLRTGSYYEHVKVSRPAPPLRFPRLAGPIFPRPSPQPVG